MIADFVSPRAEWQNLGDAYRVEARIVTWETNNAVKVPTGALFRRQDDWAVFKVQGHRAQLQRVEIGQRSENEAELLGGLREGERVILHPSDRVSDGVAVRSRSREK